MPVLKKIKFSKLDKFDNPVFIASLKADETNYNKLYKYYSKLVAMKTDTYMPVYHNTKYKYSTIRFFKDHKFKFEEKAKYDIKFSTNKKDKEGKTYINCYIESVKLVEEAPVYDKGEEIKL